MREIKFRGQRSGGEWLCGDFNRIDGKSYIFPRTDDTPANSPDWFEVNPESVGQFTGLKDKNGNEIYEGDILGYMAIPEGYPESAKRLHKVVIKWDTMNKHTFLWDHYKNEYEVIGNIYENPELL